MDNINVTVTTTMIIDHVAKKIEEVMELQYGDIAAPAPSSEQLAAVAIDALSDFRLLDGQYFAVVKEARDILGLN